MKKTETKIRINWVGVFIFTFLAFLAYCGTWIYVLEQENKQIEKQIIKLQIEQLERELVGKDYFEIEQND